MLVITVSSYCCWSCLPSGGKWLHVLGLHVGILGEMMFGPLPEILACSLLWDDLRYTEKLLRYTEKLQR